MKNILTKLLLVIFTAIFLFSGYNLLKIFLEYHAGTSEYSQAANQYVKEKEDGKNRSRTWKKDPIPVPLKLTLPACRQRIRMWSAGFTPPTL